MHPSRYRSVADICLTISCFEKEHEYDVDTTFCYRSKDMTCATQKQVRKVGTFDSGTCNDPHAFCSDCSLATYGDLWLAPLTIVSPPPDGQYADKGLPVYAKVRYEWRPITSQLGCGLAFCRIVSSCPTFPTYQLTTSRYYIPQVFCLDLRSRSSLSHYTNKPMNKKIFNISYNDCKDTQTLMAGVPNSAQAVLTK